MKNTLNKVVLTLLGLAALMVAISETPTSFQSSGVAWFVFTVCGLGVGVIEAIERATKQVVAAIERASADN